MNMDQAYKIFTDAWRLFRKYSSLPDQNNQCGWAALKNDIDCLDEQYHGNYMARKMMLALVDVLEHETQNAASRKG